MPQAETMTVKLLVHGTPHGNKGDVVDVPLALGKEMVRAHMRSGFLGEPVVHRVACTLEEYQEEVKVLEELPTDQLTAAEMTALGRRNVVESPKENGTVSEVAEKVKAEKKSKKKTAEPQE